MSPDHFTPHRAPETAPGPGATSPTVQNTTHGHSEARDTPPAVARPATPAHQPTPAGARATRDGWAT